MKYEAWFWAKRVDYSMFLEGKKMEEPGRILVFRNFIDASFIAKRLAKVQGEPACLKKVVGGWCVHSDQLGAYALIQEIKKELKDLEKLKEVQKDAYEFEVRQLKLMNEERTLMRAQKEWSADISNDEYLQPNPEEQELIRYREELIDEIVQEQEQWAKSEEDGWYYDD
jgi:hypothetical protein